MNKIVDKFRNHNSYLLVTYIFILIVVVKYSDTIFSTANSSIRAFSSLYVGIGLAYVLNIPMRSIEKKISKFIKKKSRLVSIIITYILALLVVGIILSLIVPQLVETIASLVERSGDFEAAYINVANYVEEKIGIEIPVDIGEIFNSLSSSMNVIINSIAGSLSSIANGSVTFFVALVVSIYLLASKEQLVRQLKKMLVSVIGVARGNKVLVFSRKVNGIFTNYISGLLLDAVVIGALIFLMMTILGLPYAVLVGVLTSVLAIIPIFGNIMSMLFGALLILAVNPLQALIFIIGYQVVQQLENNLVYPRIVGSSVGLPGLWTLLAVSVAGAIFGFTGMLIAVPVTSTIYMVLSEFANGRMKKNKVKINYKGDFQQQK